MSIDILCYAAFALSETKEILERLVISHADLFPRCMTAPHARPATSVDVDIASEHGLVPISAFLISVNDKHEAHRVPQLADALRDVFQESAAKKRRLLILRDNEKPL